MRDLGLEEAIRAAGGVGALARKTGVSQPSISNWSRVPAEYVLAVEAATGVGRGALRRDLYGEHPGMVGDLDDVDAARAQEYALLSVLLARAPDRALLERLAVVRGDPSPLGLAHAALAEAAQRTSAGLIISPAFCTSARSRGCARILKSLQSSEPPARRSPRITRRFCARSWRAWRTDALVLPPMRIASCSSSILSHGSGAFSPISSGPMLPTFTGTWERSAGCSSRSKRRPLRCPREQRAGIAGRVHPICTTDDDDRRRRR